MTAVVTGAAGFVGSHLLTALIADGREVTAIDRRPIRWMTGVTPIQAELSESDHAVAKALAAANVVYHLAGCPGVRDRSPDVGWRRHRDNVMATQQVLSLTPGNVPVVVTSSSSVYGGSTGAPCTEDFPINPRGGYAESKVDAERLCAARLGGGGRVVITRLFTVTGERQRKDMALARWIDAILAGRPVIVYGGLKRTRDIVDVHDVIVALQALAATDHNGIVNIGTGVAYSLQEMLDAVQAATERPLRIETHPVADDDPYATLADPARLTRLTGLRPHTDLTALVRRQVDAVLLGDDVAVPTMFASVSPSADRS